MPARAVVKIVCGRWILIRDLAEILSLSTSEAYEWIRDLAVQSHDYTLLLKEGDLEPRVLILPKKEWHQMLRFVAMTTKR